RSPTDHLVLLACFISSTGTVSAFWAALWWWCFHEDPRRHPGITNAELAALPAATGQPGSGPVPWRRSACGAVDDCLLLSGLDGVAGCDLDAVFVPEKLRSRSEEIILLLRGDAVQRDARRIARRGVHRLSAETYSGPADRTLTADSRELDPRSGGPRAGD